MWVDSQFKSGTLRLRTNGAVRLDVLVGDYYGVAPVVAQSFPPGPREWSVFVPSSLHAVMVGVNQADGTPRELTAPVDFELSLDPP